MTIETRFQVIESGSGYPVICIHGNGLNRELWRHLVPQLSEKFRTVVYELRGMGKSESVSKPGSKITVEDHADDLGAVMDALEIEQAAIVAKRQHQIIGDKAQVAERLSELASSVEVDELSVISITHKFEQRARCYELLAEAFTLSTAK